MIWINHFISNLHSAFGAPVFNLFFFFANHNNVISVGAEFTRSNRTNRYPYLFLSRMKKKISIKSFSAGKLDESFSEMYKLQVLRKRIFISIKTRATMLLFQTLIHGDARIAGYWQRRHTLELIIGNDCIWTTFFYLQHWQCFWLKLPSSKAKYMYVHLCFLSHIETKANNIMPLSSNQAVCWVFWFNENLSCVCI